MRTTIKFVLCRPRPPLSPALSQPPRSLKIPKFEEREGDCGQTIKHSTGTTGTRTVVKKLRPRIFLKYGSLGQFFPLNVAQWCGGANIAEKTPRWCGGAMI